MAAPRRVYADHHATTPLRPEALEAMIPWLSGLAANPSSIHAPGREARKAVEAARRQVASALGALPDEVVFTSGGTESDALAVRGGARAARERDGVRTRVAFSAAEHAAVREAGLSLAVEGFEPREVAVDASGLPLPEELSAVLDGRSALLSLLLANNETGVVNRGLPEAARAARDAGAVVHTDAVQAVGRIPVRPSELGVDMLSFTGHKLGGPKGAGLGPLRQGVRVVGERAEGRVAVWVERGDHLAVVDERLRRAGRRHDPHRSVAPAGEVGRHLREAEAHLLVNGREPRLVDGEEGLEVEERVTEDAVDHGPRIVRGALTRRGGRRAGPSGCGPCIRRRRPRG